MLNLYKVLLLIIIPAITFFCNTQDNPSKDINQAGFKKARIYMVESQIRARGITDTKVLEAFRKVERHLFVPRIYQSEAYNDYPLPIGEDQTISQPYIVAFMTNILQIVRNEKILEIGTGSGYQAAILGELCDSVFTIEIKEKLGIEAKSRLKELGYKNILVKIGDGYKGWPEYAPYDAIIVTCSPSSVPELLINQLKDGGRMIIPVGKGYNQKLILLEKSDGKIKEKDVLPVLFVPMVDKKGNSY